MYVTLRFNHPQWDSAVRPGRLSLILHRNIAHIQTGIQTTPPVIHRHARAHTHTHTHTHTRRERERERGGLAHAHTHTHTYTYRGR
jgi:hypothetical protein